MAIQGSKTSLLWSSSLQTTHASDESLDSEKDASVMARPVITRRLLRLLTRGIVLVVGTMIGVHVFISFISVKVGACILLLSVSPPFY